MNRGGLWSKDWEIFGSQLRQYCQCPRDASKAIRNCENLVELVTHNFGLEEDWSKLIKTPLPLEPLDCSNPMSREHLALKEVLANTCQHRLERKRNSIIANLHLRSTRPNKSPAEIRRVEWTPGHVIQSQLVISRDEGKAFRKGRHSMGLRENKIKSGNE